MSFYLNNNNIRKIYLNSNEVKKVYYNNSLVHSGEFSPLNISGLQLWLDASDASTIHEDDSAGRVSQWDDKSGNGHHAVQATTAEQPDTGTRTLNSLNVIDFDGTQSLDLNSGLYGVPQNPNTVITVAKSDTFGPNLTLYGSNSGGLHHYIRIDSLNGFGYNNASGQSQTVYIGADTDPHVLIAGHNDVTQFIYRDGGSGATNGTPTAFTQTESEISRDGAEIDGFVAEVLTYNRFLSVSERNQIGNYLADKWEIILWSDIT